MSSLLYGDSTKLFRAALLSSPPLKESFIYKWNRLRATLTPIQFILRSKQLHYIHFISLSARPSEERRGRCVPPAHSVEPNQMRLFFETIFIYSCLIASVPAVAGNVGRSTLYFIFRLPRPLFVFLVQLYSESCFFSLFPKTTPVVSSSSYFTFLSPKSGGLELPNRAVFFLLLKNPLYSNKIIFRMLDGRREEGG